MHFVFLAFSAMLLEVFANGWPMSGNSLAGIPHRSLNLRAFQERLEYSLALSARDGEPLTLAYVDLDDFKRVNDLHGHAQGDLVLTTVGEVLTEVIRPRTPLPASAATSSRCSCLVPARPEPPIRCQAAQRLAERFLAMDMSVTCSVGAVTFPRPPDSSDAAIRLADRLMYQVKGRGKNAIAFATFDRASGALIELADADRRAGTRLPRRP